MTPAISHGRRDIDRVRGRQPGQCRREEGLPQNGIHADGQVRPVLLNRGDRHDREDVTVVATVASCAAGNAGRYRER